jgi:hypothetical protein
VGVPREPPVFIESEEADQEIDPELLEFSQPKLPLRETSNCTIAPGATVTSLGERVKPSNVEQAPTWAGLGAALGEELQAESASTAAAA